MSSKMKVDFDEMFAITLKALKLNGSHPYIPRDRKWFASFIIKHGIFTVVFIVMLYNIYLSIMLQNFSEACRYGTVSVVYCVVSYQYAVLLVHQKTLLKIIEMMKADFEKDMQDARAIVYIYARKGRMVCLEWLILSVSTVLIFIGKHIFLELYLYVIDEWKLLPMYPLTYPGVIEEYKEQPVVFSLLYILVLFYLLYSSIMYVAFVPLGPMFMIHATGQLEIVKKRSLELYAQESTVDVNVKINEIVQHLQYIYRFVDLVKETFRVVYEFGLKATTVILPITIYEVIGSFHRGDFSLDYVNIIVGSILFSSDPCYHSDKLMEKGEEVRLAIYSCGWETRYDHGVRKTLVVILLRTLQPIAIRTIFQTLCLDTFTDCLRQSYALFNLMNAAWGQ